MLKLFIFGSYGHQNKLTAHLINFEGKNLEKRTLRLNQQAKNVSFLFSYVK